MKIGTQMCGILTTHSVLAKMAPPDLEAVEAMEDYIGVNCKNGDLK